MKALQEFDAFIYKYSKVYTGRLEYELRKQIFMDNFLFINKIGSDGRHKINYMADWSLDEFRQKLLVK